MLGRIVQRRTLFLVHRWLGIVLCAFFILWFVSGVVMLYARMPLLYASERFAALPALDLDAVRLSADSAWRAAGRHDVPPAKARLVTVLGRPTWLFQPAGEKWTGVRADDGAPLAPVTVADGAREARRFVGATAMPSHVATFDGIDQWTFSNSMNLHRPLHRYRFDDGAGTEVYVSQVTGEVVNRTTRRERVGAAVGAYVHWLAPEVLRRSPGVWRNLLLYLSVAGVALALSGLVIGVLRYRRRGYRGRTGLAARLPYRGAMAWHAWTGLAVGGATATWMFSAVLYMNPGGRRSGPLSTVTTVTPYNEGGVRADLAPRREHARALSGGPLALPLWTAGVADVWGATLPEAAPAPPPPKEVELVRFDGRPYYVFAHSDTESRVAPADGAHGTHAVARFDASALAAAVGRGVRGGALVESTLLFEYDAYYYAVGAVAPKRLPILRLKFDDPDRTWFYVNPHTATIFRRYDEHGRLMRWLVNGLHTLDFPWLIAHRPAWDVVVIGLSLLGVALSGSAAVIGTRRLRQELRGAGGSSRRATARRRGAPAWRPGGVKRPAARHPRDA